MSERTYSTSHRPSFGPALLKPRYWPTWLLFGLSSLLAWLPPALLRGLNGPLTALVLRVDGKPVYEARCNLAACFIDRGADEVQRLLREHVANLVHGYLLFGRLMFRSARVLRRHARFEGLEPVRAAAAAGHGIILVVPHTVGFEFAGQCLQLEQPLTSVARVHADDPAMDWLVSRYRNRFGGVFFDNRQSMMPLIKAVRSGRWLYYLPDEDRKEAGAVFAPFFGVPKLTVPSLGRLARACRAQVVPVRVTLDRHRSSVTVAFGAPEVWPQSDDDAAEARRINAMIEALLAGDPAQFAWTGRLFRTRPEGTPPLYG